MLNNNTKQKLDDRKWIEQNVLKKNKKKIKKNQLNFTSTSLKSFKQSIFIYTIGKYFIF